MLNSAAQVSQPILQGELYRNNWRSRLGNIRRAWLPAAFLERQIIPADRRAVPLKRALPPARAEAFQRLFGGVFHPAADVAVVEHLVAGGAAPFQQILAEFRRLLFGRDLDLVLGFAARTVELHDVGHIGLAGNGDGKIGFVRKWLQIGGGLSVPSLAGKAIGSLPYSGPHAGPPLLRCNLGSHYECFRCK